MGVVWRIVSSSFVVLPILWIIELVRHSHYRFNDGLMPTIGITLVVIVLFFIGWGNATSWSEYFARTILESECPCCGLRATREFVKERAIQCKNCVAYLRADGDAVVEERLDAVFPRFCPYVVTAARYLPAATTDEQGNIAFRLPDICAMCGSGAGGKRQVVDAFASGGSGILGTIVEEAAYSAMSRESRARTGLWGPTGTGSVRGSSASSTQDEASLADLKFPVCYEHGSGPPPVEYSPGRLWFASYRYYKEFLAANYIDAPLTQRR